MAQDKYTGWDKMYNLTTAEASVKLTPTSEEQVWLILSGECPHNNGWIHAGACFGITLLKCALCGEAGAV